MQKDFTLPNEIITKIFSYCNKRFIFEKILIEPPLVKEINVFNNEIYPSFTNVNLHYGDSIHTNIAIPEINKKISSQFNLKKPSLMKNISSLIVVMKYLLLKRKETGIFISH